MQDRASFYFSQRIYSIHLHSNRTPSPTPKLWMTWSIHRTDLWKLTWVSGDFWIIKIIRSDTVQNLRVIALSGLRRVSPEPEFVNFKEPRNRLSIYWAIAVEKRNKISCPFAFYSTSRSVSVSTVTARQGIGFYVTACELKVTICGLKGTQDWEFFWLRFWNLYYFFVSYVKIKDFTEKIFCLCHYWRSYNFSA